MTSSMIDKKLYKSIKTILENARAKAYVAVNFAMVEAYWDVGRLIVETIGEDARSLRGKSLMGYLSENLTQDFGKGFDESNLRNMRQFYLTFPYRDALRHDITWTHYRAIMKVENPKAREYYLVKYTLSEENTQIFTSKYKLYLPTEEELRKEIES